MKNLFQQFSSKVWQLSLIKDDLIRIHNIVKENNKLLKDINVKTSYIINELKGSEPYIPVKKSRGRPRKEE
jgi:hypothetical protein